ncbi:hypothetical protein C8J57DRAFT_1519448 [Mycena rebaudengoi]|nr:hypothetical protein C8J57DRAFT_1519448 [Mycena rebaudengoi]
MVNSTGRKLQKVDVTSFATRQRGDVPCTSFIAPRSASTAPACAHHRHVVDVEARVVSPHDTDCDGSRAIDALTVRRLHDPSTTRLDRTGVTSMQHGQDLKARALAARYSPRRMSLDADYDERTMQITTGARCRPQRMPRPPCTHPPASSRPPITVEQQEQRDVEQREQQRVEQEWKRDTPPQSRADRRHKEQKRVPAQPVQPVANGSAWAVQWQQARIAPLEPAA